MSSSKKRHTTNTIVDDDDDDITVSEDVIEITDSPPSTQADAAIVIRSPSPVEEPRRKVRIKAASTEIPPKAVQPFPKLSMTIPSTTIILDEEVWRRAAGELFKNKDVSNIMKFFKMMKDQKVNLPPEVYGQLGFIVCKSEHITEARELFKDAREAGKQVCLYEYMIDMFVRFKNIVELNDILEKMMKDLSIHRENRIRWLSTSLCERALNFIGHFTLGNPPVLKILSLHGGGLLSTTLDKIIRICVLSKEYQCIREIFIRNGLPQNFSSFGLDSPIKFYEDLVGASLLVKDTVSVKKIMSEMIFLKIVISDSLRKSIIADRINECDFRNAFFYVRDASQREIIISVEILDLLIDECLRCPLTLFEGHAPIREQKFYSEKLMYIVDIMEKQKTPTTPTRYNRMLAFCVSIKSIEYASKILLQMQEMQISTDGGAYSNILGLFLNSEGMNLIDMWTFLDKMVSIPLYPSTAVYSEMFDKCIEAKNYDAVEQILKKYCNIHNHPDRETCGRIWNMYMEASDPSRITRLVLLMKTCGINPFGG